jgi:predicted nucleic acid-binding protein
MFANRIGVSDVALTIVDSDILIDVARGEADAINCLLSLEQTSTLAISAVTQMELTVGCRNKTGVEGPRHISESLPDSENRLPSF